MLKNLAILAAATLIAALLTLATFSRVGPSDEAGPSQPLEPPPGETLRLQPRPPRPAPADPTAVSRALAEKELRDGDRLLFDALAEALSRGEKPTYKASVDVPLNDQAARAIADEVKDWITAKMAGFGYTDAEGKPTVLWTVHVDPAEQGRYTLDATVRGSGGVKQRRTFELPFEYTQDRISRTLDPTFAPPDD